MKLPPFVSGIAVLAGLSAGAAVPAFAQTTHPVGRTATGLATIAPPTPDADELAEQMRVLAKDPKDVGALIRAGELTLLLGDPTAAAVLFSRAEKIEPGNARMKAGMAATLVRMERPGEALRLFAEAERGGYDAEKFAAERGLAYDLVGAQDYAQRDYRLALDREKSDETVRRYALSLGISGQKDVAMAALDPLLRKQDRAAWRDRAFILAMNGEADEAEKIASAMMPGPVSEGLKPFFEQLAGLSAVDRAFAVHFGELRPTPARLADATLVPALPPLSDRPAPTRLASAEPVVAKTPARSARREGAGRDRRGSEKTPPLAPGRTPLSASTPVSSAAPRPTEASEGKPPADVASAPIRMADGAASTTMRPAETPVRAPEATPHTAAPTAVAATTTSPAIDPPATDAAPSAVGREDSILARIVANITVPASELGVAPMRDREPASTPFVGPTVGSEANEVARAQAALDTAAAKAEAERLAAVEQAAKRKAERDAKVEADRKAAAKKAADDKAAAAKKAAAEKAAEAKKAKAEPSRIWVQVAGGANEGNLARAFGRVVDKAPALMKGKQGWWTPLNATNRVLTGPFKSAAEAQAFVNKLAGAGVSAFPFTSKDGQKVTKLSSK